LLNEKKRHFRTTLQLMVCMTLNYVGPTQSRNFMWIIHRKFVGLKCFYHLLKCLLLLLVFLHLYYTR